MRARICVPNITSRPTHSPLGRFDSPAGALAADVLTVLASTGVALDAVGCNDHDILVESHGDVTVRLNKDLAGAGPNEFAVKDGDGNTRLRVFEDGTAQIFGSLEISGVAAVRGLEGTGTMDFGSVAAGSCSATVFFSVSGAGAGDRAVLIPPDTLPSGLFLVPIEMTGGGIRARMCNLTASAIDPPALSVQYVLLR